jgi:hypothetical protein
MENVKIIDLDSIENNAAQLLSTRTPITRPINDQSE